MKWQTIRSWRDPGFWLPLASAVCVVLVLGVVAQSWTRGYLQELRLLGVSDPRAAAAAAERGLLVLGQAVFGFTLVFGALFFRYFQLGFRQQRLPPCGWWSLGARRALLGSYALRFSRIGLALSLVLPIAGVICLLTIRSGLAGLRLPA